MNGKLIDQPLAELIREIASKALSGVLRLECESAKTAVYLERGQIVFAASNLRTLRLREYLKKQNLISDKEFALLKTPSADLRTASKLHSGGRLSKRDFDSLLTTLVADILRVALLWTDGKWEFDERARLDEPVRVTFDPGGLMKEAAQRLPLQFVSRRFRNPNEIISRSPAGATGNNFLPAESFILSRLDQPTKLEELVAVSGLRELDAYRVIYGLALSGFVQREYWQNAFRTQAAKPVTGPQVGAPSLPEVLAGKPEVTDHWAQASDKDSEDNLGEFLERLRAATDFYEVIDVMPTASVNEIKEAYYALARRYHPDRFHLKSGTRLHEQISSAFARITQAYETLMDPTARLTYDTTLEKSRKFEQSAPKPSKAAAGPLSTDAGDVDSGESTFGNAEQYFREGFSALEQGQFGAAITQLAAACRLNPQEARFRAYYGRALAGVEQTRRLAESEIQTAVKLEPTNALYRTMLAELYFDLKFHRRAQTELDRALEINPNSGTALRLLRKLKKSRKVQTPQ